MQKAKIDTQENGLSEPDRVKSPEDVGLKTGGKASNLMHEVPRLEKPIATNTKIKTRKKLNRAAKIRRLGKSTHVVETTEIGDAEIKDPNDY